LLETHRFNFTGDAPRTADALAEVGRALALALAMFPALRFMPTGELAAALRSADPSIVTRDPRPRVHAWLNRLGEVTRLRKLAMMTGLAAPAALLLRLTRPAETEGRDVAVGSASR
jgi:hypothetical protein